MYLYSKHAQHPQKIPKNHFIMMDCCKNKQYTFIFQRYLFAKECFLQLNKLLHCHHYLPPKMQWYIIQQQCCFANLYCCVHFVLQGYHHLLK